MTGVAVAILHPEPGPEAGQLTRLVAAARAAEAGVHERGFRLAGADRVTVLGGPPDERTFGARLVALLDGLPDGDGLIVLGSGAVPLLTARERAAFLAAAAGELDGGAALANNAYSADIVAVPDARRTLAGAEVLTTDNALPRWLAQHGVTVRDRRGAWRLGVDIDGPLDLLLLGGRWRRHVPDAARALPEDRLAAIRAVVRDPAAELVVAGRTAPSALTWLEGATASRTRALVEERGFRTAPAGQRRPASVLAMLLDRDGPAALGTTLAALGEAALVDTRVLLAHRHGADERGWPAPEDRFASDLLLADRIADPWLRELTASAATAPIPVVLGGHTLVGPGLRLALAAR